MTSKVPRLPATAQQLSGWNGLEVGLEVGRAALHGVEVEDTLAAEPAPSPAPALSPRLRWTLTAATVLAVGNVYYSQPLLGELGHGFGQPPASTGAIPLLSQLGYVSGLLFVTPLGDVSNKRRLLVLLLVLAGLALLAAGRAPTFPLFLVASFAVGVTAVLVQILIPFVASLSAPAERAKNLGTMLGAALIGVLLSRTLSGFVSTHLGWRGVYLAAAVSMFALVPPLWLGLPDAEPATRMAYPRLLQSVWQLVRDVPALRSIAITGALMYASLTVFWAALAFYLQSAAYRVGPEVAGTFGLVGAVGALAANLTGRGVERIGARRLVRGSILVMAAAWATLALVGGRYPGLVLGVVLLDLGAQAATVSNQTEIYRYVPHAQTRGNTVYKIFYFGGGGIGAFCSAAAWGAFGWHGVCALGLFFLGLAFGWEQVLQRWPGRAAATVE